MKQSSLILAFGVTGLVVALAYADGLTFMAVSAICFVPAVALALVLRSRVRRKKVEEIAMARCATAVGLWLLVSSIVGALMVARPGREGAGMFGVLIFIWPLGVSLVASVIVAAFLPKKRLTYDR